MRHKLAFILLVGMVASPALADLKTTQTWEFTAGSVQNFAGAYYAAPTTWTNPNATVVSPPGIVATGNLYMFTGGTATYNASQGTFSNVNTATFLVPNYPDPNPLKYVEVQVTYKPDDVLNDASVGIQSIPPTSVLSTEFGVTQLDLGGWWVADYKFTLVPNPQFEYVTIGFRASINTLDSVTIKTECVPIPAPGAALLGFIGLGLVGWLKRRLP